MKPDSKFSNFAVVISMLTLSLSIILISGTGLAEGATSVSKEIKSLKSQIKSLQERVELLESAPEIAQGEQGETGPQGPQGIQGPPGPAGTVSGLQKKTIRYLQKDSLFGCSGSLSDALGFNDARVVTDVTSSTDSRSGAITRVSATQATLKSCSIEVYTP